MRTTALFAILILEILFISTASASEISFSDVYSDIAIDIDSNGYEDYLEISIGVNVVESGNYSYFARLYDINNNFISYSNRMISLSPADDTIFLNFSGRDIYLKEYNGSLYLKELTIRNSTFYDVDFRDSPYQTEIYNYTDFEKTKMSFIGLANDYGSDDDGDSSFENLTMEIELNSEIIGDFIVTGNLYDDSNSLITTSQTKNNFVFGDNIILLNFSGEDINLYGSSGNYVLKSLQVNSENYQKITSTNSEYITSFYNFEDFEIPDTFLIYSKFSDYGNDTNFNGLYDSLTLDMSIFLNQSGNFKINAFLFDVNGHYLGSQTYVKTFDSRTQNISFNFLAANVQQATSDGTFTIEFEIYDNIDNLVLRSDNGYITNSYSTADFEQSPIDLTNSYLDYGKDINNDNLDEYLTIEVELDVNVQGQYEIVGYLYDKDGTYIEFASTQLDLNSGQQTAMLNFEGPPIRKNGVNGYFTLSSLEIYDINGQRVHNENNLHNTKKYYYDNFSLTIPEYNDNINELPSSGGVGSGGSGTTGETFENIEVKDVVMVYVTKDSAITYEFKEAASAIDFVSFDAVKSAGYITATIEILKDTSALVSSAPSGEVYQNMNIWIGKGGYATENNIANPIIGFRVAKSWITENNIDISTIKLNRYSSGAWNQLPTTKMVDEDDIYIYFSSETPGFSPFAITGDEISSTVVADTQDPSATTSSTENDDVNEPVSETVDTPDDEENTSGAFAMVIGLFGISLLGIGMVIKREEIGKWIGQRRS